MTEVDIKLVRSLPSESAAATAQVTDELALTAAKEGQGSKL